MKYLIVGLGNPGIEYLNTRHNIGFKILDAFAKASNVVFSTARYSLISETRAKGRQIILLKPTTYVNLSGKAIDYWLKKEKIDIKNLMVVLDDIQLPFSTIRIRPRGNDGGHNGLKNINETFGHNEYSRLRFGVGNNFSRGNQIDYVLGEWTYEEEKQLTEKISLACDALMSFIFSGIERTMNQYNTKEKSQKNGN